MAWRSWLIEDNIKRVLLHFTVFIFSPSFQQNSLQTTATMVKSSRKATVKNQQRRKRRVAPPRGPHVSLFHYLPNELLYLIRNFLPQDDLRSHIAFQASCRQVRVIYADDEKFWKAACVAYGIGRPNASRQFPYSIPKCTWREIAIVVVNHQECCDVPACARYVPPSECCVLFEATVWKY